MAFNAKYPIIPALEFVALTASDLGLMYKAGKYAASFSEFRIGSFILACTAASTTYLATNFVAFSLENIVCGKDFEYKDMAMKTVFGPTVFAVEAFGSMGQNFLDSVGGRGHQ